MKGFYEYYLAKKQFIKEAEELDLDIEYLANAEKCSAFDLNPKEFNNTNRKNEIRFLITKQWFPEFTGFISGAITKEKINEAISALKKESSANFKRLFEYNVKGIGPGEAMLYYLHDDAVLGGGTSAGVDIKIGSNEYECKAALYGKKDGRQGDFLYNFKLGGSKPISSIISGLKDLTGITKAEVNAGDIAKVLNSGDPKVIKEYNRLENEYREAFREFFEGTDFIFFNNAKTGKLGEVLHIGKVNLKNVFIERITSGTIKPIIKL